MRFEGGKGEDIIPWRDLQAGARCWQKEGMGFAGGIYINFGNRLFPGDRQPTFL